MGTHPTANRNTSISAITGLFSSNSSYSAKSHTKNTSVHRGNSVCAYHSTATKLITWACPKTAVALVISRCREPARAWTQSHSEHTAGWHPSAEIKAAGAPTSFRNHSDRNNKPRPGCHLHHCPLTRAIPSAPALSLPQTA